MNQTNHAEVTGDVLFLRWSFKIQEGIVHTSAALLLMMGYVCKLTPVVENDLFATLWCLDVSVNFMDCSILVRLKHLSRAA